MTRTLLLVSLLFVSLSSFATVEDELALCLAETDAELKLDCYERLAKAAVAESVIADTAPNPALEEVARNFDEGAPEEEPSSFANFWSILKLDGDDPNFFGYSTQAGNRKRGVVQHLEFDISLKYPMWENDNKGKGADRLFFIYNGSYDFQALTNDKIYDSSPIISTTQNPGIAAEWDLGEGEKLGEKRIRFGFFHHSNGQTLSDSGDEIIPAEPGMEPIVIRHGNEEFQRILSDWKEAPALERVSRASWYWQLRYQWMSNSNGDIGNDWEQFQFELRHLIKTDDHIFWDTIPEHQPRLQEVDGIRAVYEKMFPINEHLRVLGRLEVQTGTSYPFENIGGQLSLGFNIKNLLGLNTRNFLFSTYYYNGFTKDIASYHIRTRHVGIGLDLR